MLSGIKLNLIDTAGIRETDDIVEKIGVNKSLEVLKNANLAIFVLDNSEKISDEELNLINNTNINKIIFINNIDISKIKSSNIIYGNTINANGLDDLKKKIIDLFNLDEIKNNNYNYLSNARDIALCKNAYNSIMNAITSVNNNIPYEMIEVDLKDAYDYLGEIIGEKYDEDVIDEMFSKFCVGK